MTTPGGGVYSTSVPYFLFATKEYISQILTTPNLITAVLYIMFTLILMKGKCFATLQRTIKKRNKSVETERASEEKHKSVPSFINRRQSTSSGVTSRHLTQAQPTTLYCTREKQPTAMQLEFADSWLILEENREMRRAGN